MSHRRYHANHFSLHARPSEYPRPELGTGIAALNHDQPDLFCLTYAVLSIVGAPTCPHIAEKGNDSQVHVTSPDVDVDRNAGRVKSMAENRSCRPESRVFDDHLSSTFLYRSKYMYLRLFPCGPGEARCCQGRYLLFSWNTGPIISGQFFSASSVPTVDRSTVVNASNHRRGVNPGKGASSSWHQLQKRLRPGIHLAMQEPREFFKAWYFLASRLNLLFYNITHPDADNQYSTLEGTKAEKSAGFREHEAASMGRHRLCGPALN